MSAGLGAALARLGRPRILVVGDVMLDEEVRGTVSRLDPEAPVPVLEVRGRREDAGGAGNLARNLQGLGAEVRLAGLVGRDAAGARLRAILRAHGLEEPGLLHGVEGPTTRKTRLRSEGRLLLRVDAERRDARGDVLVPALARALADVDLVVVADHGKGVVTPGVLAALRSGGRPVIVDPAPGRPAADYAGVRALAPNLVEAEGLVEGGAGAHPSPGDRAAEIARRAGVPTVLLTLGAAGACLHDRGRTLLLEASPAPSGGDAVGAGDAALAVFATAIGSGLAPEAAARLAMVGGALALRDHGVVTVTRADLARHVASREPALLRPRIVTAPEARARIDRVRRVGRRVAFANGCFDLLHPGHLALLAWARERADLLVVGLNGDASVRRLKGAGRPVLPAAARAGLLASLREVDLVVIFEEDTPAALVRALGPDVLVKGEDWRHREVVGREVVEARGGEVLFCPRLGDWSTTGLVERWRAAGLEVGAR